MRISIVFVDEHTFGGVQFKHPLLFLLLLVLLGHTTGSTRVPPSVRILVCGGMCKNV